MVQEKVDLINRLMEIEEQLQELWDYHPDNPNGVDIVAAFNDLQRDAATIESYLQTLWTPEDDEDVM